jgi:hypothetical protein
LANTYFESAPHKAHIVVALFVALLAHCRSVTLTRRGLRERPTMA